MFFITYSPRIKRMEHELNTRLHLGAKLKKSGVVPSLPTLCIQAIFFLSRTWASNLFMPKGKSLITGWFASRTWKNNKWYT